VFDYDEELPRGFQDADIELAEMEALGNRVAYLEANGVCTHGATLGHGDGNGPLEGGLYYPEQAGIKPGQQRCRDCGELFESDEDWAEARAEALQL
jgi:hypothetical protein